MRASAKIIGGALTLLLLVMSLIWYVAQQEGPRNTLRVSFLGDTVFVEAPSGRSLVINGGSDDSVVRELGNVMPFYKRSIDIVIATAPEAGDVTGLIDVLSRYRVSSIVRSAAHSGAPQMQSFTTAVSQAEQQGTRLIVWQRRSVIDLGKGAFIETLFPDRDASQFAPSDGCLIFKLIFGETSFLFSCGPAAIENYLATLDGAKLKSDVMLASGNDSELFAGFASPQFAVVPCNLSASSSVFSKLEIQTLDTCKGAVTFISNGQEVSKE